MTNQRIIPHIHVSEQETKHLWPDGRLDDAAWEDCLWASAIEWLRGRGHNIPATHAEAEALRAASGEPPTGGSTFADLALGMAKRYRLTLSASLTPTQFFNQFRPGTCAIVTGPYSAAPQKLQARDQFEHAVYVEMRLDGSILWCDPIGPPSYSGIIIKPEQLQKFVRSAVLAPLALKEDLMGIQYKRELWKVPKGTPFYRAIGDGGQAGIFSDDAEVETLGAPYRPDGTIDWAWRLGIIRTAAINGVMERKAVWIPRRSLTWLRQLPDPPTVETVLAAIEKTLRGLY